MMKKLSNNNTIFLTIMHDTGAFSLSAIMDNKTGKYYQDIAVTEFPNSEDEDYWDNADYVNTMYKTLLENIDWRNNTITYNETNMYIKEWFEIFYQKTEDMFTLTKDFIDGYEDLQRLINNEKQ